jgi:hypothetical protein
MRAHPLSSPYLVVSLRALADPYAGRHARCAVLLGVLTVRETIQYAARLRLAPSHSPAPAEVAEAVMEELGLSECGNTIIGTWYQRGVSGGQRRRVVIGCEVRWRAYAGCRRACACAACILFYLPRSSTERLTCVRTIIHAAACRVANAAVSG